MKAGKTIFWLGFWITFGVVVAFLVLMLCGALAFTGYAATLSLCGIVLVGAFLMVLGRSYEQQG